jgi:hypothetical protein
MSIEALQREVRALPSEERRKLMAFMVVLEDEGRSDYAAKLAERIDDNSPGRWLSPNSANMSLDCPMSTNERFPPAHCH